MFTDNRQELFFHLHVFKHEVDAWINAFDVIKDIHVNKKQLGDVTKWREWDIDWASITVTEFARYCPDQADALDSCPTEWSAEDLSMFLFGRKGWAIFASYFSCQLKTLLSDPDTRDESEIAEVTKVLASKAWLKACRQRHATVGIAGHPLDLYNSLKSKEDSDF